MRQLVDLFDRFGVGLGLMRLADDSEDPRGDAGGTISAVMSRAPSQQQVLPKRWSPTPTPRPFFEEDEIPQLPAAPADEEPAAPLLPAGEIEMSAMVRDSSAQYDESASGAVGALAAAQDVEPSASSSLVAQSRGSGSDGAGVDAAESPLPAGSDLPVTRADG